MTPAAQRGRIGVAARIVATPGSAGLREDFVAEDLVPLQMASSGVLAAAGDAAPEASPRLVAYMLQAFRPPPSPRRCLQHLRRDACTAR
jgi:hypothetical protein